MHQIQLADDVYEQARRRAAEAGFASVDEFVADMVSHDGVDDGEADEPNVDHLFTPERLAEIDQAEADIRAGRFYTTEQAYAELEKFKAEWLRKNQP